MDSQSLKAKVHLYCVPLLHSRAGARDAHSQKQNAPAITGKKDASGALSLTGFTIAEILLVVVIIALIAGVGGGIYVGTYKKMLAEKTARQLLLTAKYARIMAIEHQSPCRIELDAANNRFWLTTEQFNQETEQVERVIVKDFYSRPIELPGEVKFEDVQIKPVGTEQAFETSENQTMVFSPNGTAQPAVVQIGNGKNHYTVSICAATGKATMHRGTAKDVKIVSIDLDEL